MLIDRAIDAGGALPANYTITACRVGDEPIPGAEGPRYGDCLLRYVLQHSSDPVQILKAVYDALRSKAESSRSKRIPRCW